MRHGQLLAELPILLDRSSDNFLMGGESWRPARRSHMHVFGGETEYLSDQQGYSERPALCRLERFSSSA
ncbi:hypothetical protein DOZ69_01330 [Pseudomonas fluorescens]|nr:hypothetical protein DOZ69_01330 [Pseudomonas fluorescens]